MSSKTNGATKAVSEENTGDKVLDVPHCEATDLGKNSCGYSFPTKGHQNGGSPSKFGDEPKKPMSPGSLMKLNKMLEAEKSNESVVVDSSSDAEIMDLTDDDPKQSPKKRKAMFPDLFKSSQKKRKKITTGPAQPKNAVVTLNELRPGLEYTLAETKGPVHQPTFVLSVTINGTTFTGEGRSKKQAKQECAENALKSFVQFKNTVDAQVAMRKRSFPEASSDFASDGALEPAVSGVTKFEKEGSIDTSPSPAKKLKVETPKSGKVASVVTTPGADKNPCMMLNELKPGIAYECNESGESPATKRFTMKVTVDGHVFEGSGASKKLAKQASARSAMNKLFNVSFTPMMQGSPVMGTEGANVVPGTNIPMGDFSLNQSVADTIGKLILDKFSAVMAGHGQHARRKVLAGIVMSRGEAMEDLTVISVSTGTKCINGEHMSVNGNSLNDCHAEIISRRCLVDYLYSQLEAISSMGGSIPEESILMANTPGGGYKLKSGVKFHLFINTAPCGDARIFSPHEAQPGDGDSDRHSNRKSRGQLRTKIESGEGTIPVKSSEGIQTWDGVLQGSRLLTMSCSDKVCRWNVVGVQGALLSYYLQPIYFHSVILGSLFHPTHMYRAVVGRIQATMSGLPPPYRLHVPRLNLVSSPEVRMPGKAPNYSVNWTQGCELPEVIDTMKGKEQDKGSASRLAKVVLFRRWMGLLRSGIVTPVNRAEAANIKASGEGIEYADAKMNMKAFQEAKSQMNQAFKKAELGAWVKKPIEQDQFMI